ncbi:NAD(P)-binding protein [Rostrohypoxylon terebratum]|nr:NAD(P)-binding protein [Rostrohypoxylon terebratum]
MYLGLGFEAAKELASHDLSRLILGVRDSAKGELARAEIAQQEAAQYTQSPTSHEAHVQINYLGTTLLSLLFVEPVAFNAPVCDILDPQRGSSVIKWLDNPASFVPGETRYRLSKLLDMLWTDRFSNYIAFATVEGDRHLTDAAVQLPESHGAYLSEQRIRPFSKFILSTKSKEV